MTACALVVAISWSSAAAAREEIPVWNQQPDLVSGGAYTASVRLSDGYWAEAADDFELPFSASVESIEWWGSGGEPSELLHVIVRFYLDDQTLARGNPGAVAYQETISVLVGEEVVGPTGDDWRYTADLPVPFVASASVRYWVSIQGVKQSSQWYWYESPPDGYWGDTAMLRSEFWGFPNWSPYTELVDDVRAFSFVLYADTTPVEATTWGALKSLFR